MYKIVEESGRWEWKSTDEYGETTIWFSADWGYSLGVNIDDSNPLYPNDVVITITILRAYVTPYPVAAGGGGFWNFLGLAFDITAATRYEQVGEAEHDSWAIASSNIGSAMGNIGLTDDWKNHMIVWAAANDNDGGYETGAMAQDTTRTIYIPKSSLGPRGTFPPVPIIGKVSRWFHWEDDGVLIDPTIYTTDVEAATVDLGQFDWSYFPWAVLINGSWMSCNRSGGYVRKHINGAFSDTNESNRKNSLYPSEILPWPTVFKKVGNDWKMCSEIGLK